MKFRSTDDLFVTVNQVQRGAVRLNDGIHVGDEVQAYLIKRVSPQNGLRGLQQTRVLVQSAFKLVMGLCGCCLQSLQLRFNSLKALPLIKDDGFKVLGVRSPLRKCLHRYRLFRIDEGAWRTRWNDSTSSGHLKPGA